MQGLWQGFPLFLLVFCRITAFFASSPIFSHRGVPNHFKVGLSVFVSLISFVTMGPQHPVEFDLIYPFHVIREIMIGLLMGFTVQLFFAVFQIAGAFIDFMIGFAIVNVIDPLTGAQSPLMGNFKYIIALLLFLAFNGHLFLVEFILTSYQWVPLGSEWFARMYEGDISSFLWGAFTSVFSMAFQVAAPLVASLFLVDVALGFLSRTSPQFNIFVVGIPVKILVGIAILFLLTTTFDTVYTNVFEKMFQSLRELMTMLGGA